MATIVNQKNEVFSNITALNVVNDDVPKLPEFNSEDTINNETNSSDFLVGLIKALEGAEKLKDIVVDTIVYKLPEIESLIKEGLKQELKELVACSINPAIPDWFQNGGSGVVMKVTDIDFFGMMKTNPDSVTGGLIYTDITSEVYSKDFNTYLYYSIQAPTTQNPWGNSMIGTDVLETEFQEVGVNNNNVLKFTTSAAYSNKKLTEFNNDFIDTLTLFGEPNSVDSATFISLILEQLFGSIGSTSSSSSSSSLSSSTTKSTKEVKDKVEIEEILDCIINSEDDNITDNFFEFDNPTLGRLSQISNDRAKGIRRIETCGNLESQISERLAIDVYNTIKSATTKQAELEAVSNGLSDIADSQADMATNPKNRTTIKGNFFKDIINSLVRIVMTVIISPKFITLFAINHQIIYGQGSSYSNAKDFISKNRKLMKEISKVILKIILEILLKIALYQLSLKLAQKFAADEIEKGKLYLSRITNAIGVDPEILKLIAEL